MIPGFPGISITRPCKLSRRCDKTSRRGRWSSCENNADRRRSIGIERRARPLISSRNSTYRSYHVERGWRVELSGFMTTTTTMTRTRCRRVSDDLRRCRIINRHRNIIRKLEAWLRSENTCFIYLIVRQIFAPQYFLPFLRIEEERRKFEDISQTLLVFI